MTKKMKHIYWFAFYNLDSPSVRYRAKYPLEYFEKYYDVTYDLIIPSYSPRKIYIFLKAYFSALLFPKKDSYIVIQRVQTTFLYGTLLKMLVSVRRHNTIYDLDDADYLEGDARTLYHLVKKSRFISAGSNEILNHLKPLNSAITHITSPVWDLNIVKKKRGNVFTIGWIGGFGGEHKESMINVIFPMLCELDFSFRLTLLGVTKKEDYDFIQHYFRNYNHIIVETPIIIDWNDESFIQQKIVRFDIGIATLQNTPIQRAKSGIKAKQYMTNGVPVVSTNLPENNNTVIHEYNGFLCDNVEDFQHYIQRFYNMSDSEYAIFSQNARNSVHQFDHANYYQKVLKLVGIDTSTQVYSEQAILEESLL
jgi:glycosyltransferase involved in cell wall biosynthesis